MDRLYSIPSWQLANGQGAQGSKKGSETIGRLRPLFTDKPTVENPPKIPEKIQWVEPKLVCEVAFAEWTEDEELRQTTFLGWREDKNAKEVVIEGTPGFQRA
jgi:ATP-dependent DNA ligase